MIDLKIMKEYLKRFMVTFSLQWDLAMDCETVVISFLLAARWHSTEA